MGETCCGGDDGSAMSKAKSKSKGKTLHSGELNSKVNHKDSAYLDSIIQKRIHLFQSIQAQQVDNLQKIGGDPIRITLPDGTVKDGKKWLTSPLHIAKEISTGLAANALISQVNGILWDMARPLEGDCELKIFKFDSPEGRDTFWHSSAHILGQSLEMEYGGKLCIGPCTTRGEGFYYDAFYNDFTLNEENFDQIKAQALKAVHEKQPFERIEVSRDQALEIFSENKFKVEIINELPKDKTITVYRCGPLVDLCRGPHIPNTSFVKAFACLKASSSYWRGKADRESLQRVYGISFPDPKRLKEYLTQLEEAKKYDHRILGQNQELFFFHPLSPGSCFFLQHGARIYNKLMDFIRVEYKNRGYQEVMSPNIYNMQLWETSGHAANYKENMFVFEIEKQEFGLKPMNCPGHCLMFDHRVRSYRELPLRMADFGVLHRNELSGALTGLTRVRRFQQDDAHIFCRDSQIKDEICNALDFVQHVYKIFGFNFELELSTRPEKYLGEIETWDKAESALTEALNEFGKPWQINEGDGAFYGPKIDISVFDALKRKFQCATLQLDFQHPLRFNLSYSAEDEAKRERPVMIHRAVLGSVERMLAILLEHYKGKWPFWLSPRQAIVCPVSDKSQPYALEVKDMIHKADEDEEVVDGEVDEGDVHITPMSRKRTPIFFSEVDVKLVFKDVTHKYLRKRIVEGGKRSDGRNPQEIRPINSQCGLLPRAHGSVLFTRGETQSLGVVTLGGKQMAQRIDNLVDTDDVKRFYLQYSFPPSSVGEVRRLGAPNRREVGHGMLAERALEPILPSESDFPYTIRVESTITESNGSSSMASVCGGCLALLDAGVPLKCNVAGIAMGLVLDTQEFGGDGTPLILSDITGSEDASGDMDFKVAGNEHGITAFQMDIKVEGITIPVMEQALLQAKKGRKHILSEMAKSSPPPSMKLSKYAPLILVMKVKPEKVHAVIGSGGKKVKSIIEETGVDGIDAQDNGIIKITAKDLSSLEKAKTIIASLTMVLTVGDIYRNCEVKTILPYGVFVEIAPGREGLCHISELASGWLSNPEEVVNVGDRFDVKLIEINEKGQLRLSRRALLPDDSSDESSPTSPQSTNQRKPLEGNKTTTDQSNNSKAKKESDFLSAKIPGKPINKMVQPYVNKDRQRKNSGNKPVSGTHK